MQPFFKYCQGWTSLFTNQNKMQDRVSEKIHSKKADIRQGKTLFRRRNECSVFMHVRSIPRIEAALLLQLNKQTRLAFRTERSSSPTLSRYIVTYSTVVQYSSTLACYSNGCTALGGHVFNGCIALGGHDDIQRLYSSTLACYSVTYSTVVQLLAVTYSTVVQLLAVTYSTVVQLNI